MSSYTYTKSPVFIDTLMLEINNSDISSAIFQYANFNKPDNLVLVFDVDLSPSDKEILDDVVIDHTGIPVYVNQGCIAVSDGEGSIEFISVVNENTVTVSGIPHTFLELNDTPSNYDDGKYLKSTISGAVWDNPIGVFGNNYHGNFDEDLSSTTSTDWQQKLRLSVTNLQSGNYHIAWFYEWAYANGNFNFKCRVQIDDDIILSEQTTRPPVGNTSYYMSSSGFSINYLSGDHYIDLDYCSSRSGRTACIRSTRIVLWRVS